MDLDLDSREALYNRAIQERKSGHYDKAHETLDKAVQGLSPDDRSRYLQRYVLSLLDIDEDAE